MKFAVSPIQGLAAGALCDCHGTDSDPSCLERKTPPKVQLLIDGKPRDSSSGDAKNVMKNLLSEIEVGLVDAGFRAASRYIEPAMFS